MDFVVLVPDLPPLEGSTCPDMGLGFATAWIVTTNMLRSPTKLTSRLLTSLYIILQHFAGPEQSHHPLAIDSMPPLLLLPTQRVHSPLLKPALHFDYIGLEAGEPTPTRGTKTLVLPCACLHRVRNAPGGAFA